MFGVLRGSLAREFLSLYKEVSRDKYHGNKVLDTFRIEDGILKGCRSHAIALANEIGSEMGIRVASHANIMKYVYPVDGERNFKLFSGGKYTYTAMVIYERPNFSHNAKEIYKEVKSKGSEPPALISLTDILNKNDDMSECGLSFVLRKGAKIVSDRRLLFEDIKKTSVRFSITDKNGIPIFDKNGKAIFYRRCDNDIACISLNMAPDGYTDIICDHAVCYLSDDIYNSYGSTFFIESNIKKKHKSSQTSLAKF
ncbi:MAG: hypothetical protein PHU12_02510 [Candidatus Aenigmarchaeota archaeon]|nr:hypothetical protein [Candidatus Aenigmarchaeota archaeon]